jgi:tRNA(Arg) A34 adenosine deaminase TadA
MLSQSTLIRLALIEARLSDNRHRLGAVIFRKNTVLSSNHNYSLRGAKKLHPRFSKWKGSIHAEVATILSARCDLSGASMFLLRINRKEELLLSKPCVQCLSYISFVGIRRVIYSTGSGFETIEIK